MKNIINYIKNNKKEIILLGFTILLFIILSILIITKKANHIDTLFFSHVINIRTNNLTSFLEIITNLAGATFLLAISTILLIVIKKKQIPLYILINLICAFLTNQTFKSIFTRTRPIGINLIDETGYSYPSGHSMIGLSFYGFIIYLIYKNIKNKLTKTILIASLILTILLIGFSRIYLGVHYLTDVIGGFLLSIIYLTIYIKIINLEKK